MKWCDFLETDFNEGDMLWICDYRCVKDVINKAARHIPPTRVTILRNTDKQRIYYSHYHFRVMKGDKMTAKVIAPFDGTGYRSYAGVALQVFLTEREAIKHYSEQCVVIRDKATVELARYTSIYKKFLINIEKVIYASTR